MSKERALRFSSVLEGIKTYEAGKPIELVVREFGIDPKDIIKLASNENPNGCSKKVIEAVQKIVPNMALYPDDSMLKLKNALAKRFGVQNSNIIIGAGSDQVIEFLIHAKASQNSTVLMNKITFAMYEIYAKHVGAKIIKTDSTHHDLAQFSSLYKEHKPSVIFICTPNNPTGDVLTKDEIYNFLDGIDSDTLVVIDGAYLEYASYKDSTTHIDPADLIERYKNVIYLGTFSKAYGLGGMRVGYGIADETIISQLYKLRPPFNITTLSLEAASVALEDEEFVQDSLKQNFEQMRRYEDFAKEMSLDIIKSYTNFVTILFDDSKSSTHIADELLKRGMIVRNLASYSLNAIRVTVGKPEQNSRFFELLKEQL